MSAARYADIVVIGAGTAGLTAIDEIDRAGRSLLVVDPGPLGTTCIRVGCIPSKAMLHAGKRWTTGNALARWNPADGARVRQQLWDEVRALRDRLVGDEVAKTHEKLGGRLVNGAARFVAPDAIDVDGMRIEARAFVIATGSSPVVPQEIAALGDGVLTTDDLFDLEVLPATLGMIGVGNVGVELGLAFSRLGVDVFAVNEKRWPAGIVDPRVADCAIRTFSKEMAMRLDAKASIERDGNALRMTVGDEVRAVDAVLAALGRKPNLDALDLAAAGVRWPRDAKPPIDAKSLRLAHAAIFVAGDASPERPLLHEAVDEAAIAARGALACVADPLAGPARDLPPRRASLDIVFTDPDVIRVGASFDELDPDATWIGEAGGTHNGRSTICDAPDNLVRLYADRHDGRLLGACAITLRGEHLAHLLALAIDRGMTAREMLGMPFYHPTFEELVQSALKDVVAQQDGRRGVA